MKNSDKSVRGLENIGFEFENRVNEKEVINDILKILKKHGVVYNELEGLFEQVVTVFGSAVKL